MQPSHDTQQETDLQAVPPEAINPLGDCPKLKELDARMTPLPLDVMSDAQREHCRSMGEFLRRSGRADDLYLLNFAPTSPSANIVPTKD